MTILTPEEIEALPKEDIRKVKDLAAELHQNTTGVLDTPFSAADIERHVRLRTAMKLKLDESMGYIKGLIADYEAMNRDLRTIKGWQTSDEARLESYMFSRIREEKKGNA
jgi:hypothetical protein